MGIYSNTDTLNTLISTGDLSLFRASEKQLIVELKVSLEKCRFYERSEIDAVNSDFQNTKSEFDLISEYSYLKGIEEYEMENQDLNICQYQSYRNYLAETLNLYGMQSDMYAAIRKLSNALIDHLKKN